MFQRLAEWRLVSGRFHAGYMASFEDLGGFGGQGMKPDMKPA